MIVAVRFFARAKDLAGAEAVNVTLADGDSVGALRLALIAAYPKLSGLLEKSALAVNDEFAKDDVAIPPGAEVALIPPVSGG